MCPNCTIVAMDPDSNYNFEWEELWGHPEEDATYSVGILYALEVAVDMGVRVINASLGGGETYGPSTIVQDALNEAWDAGVIWVNAAGNSYHNMTGWWCETGDCPGYLDCQSAYSDEQSCNYSQDCEWIGSSCQLREDIEPDSIPAKFRMFCDYEKTLCISNNIIYMDKLVIKKKLRMMQMRKIKDA